MYYQLIYPFENSIYLNWIGKYTYGSCHIRGTSINFFPSSGKIITLEGEQEIEPPKNYEFKGLHAEFRNDHSSIRLENLDLNKHLSELYFLSKVFPLEKYYLAKGDEISIEMNKNKNNSYLREDCECLISLKVPLEKIIKEINEVKEYAIKNDVILHWV